MCTRKSSYKCSQCTKKVEKDEAYCHDCYEKELIYDPDDLKDQIKELEEKLDYYREELNNERACTAIDIIRFIRRTPSNTTRDTIIRMIKESFYDVHCSDSS